MELTQGARVLTCLLQYSQLVTYQRLSRLS